MRCLPSSDALGPNTLLGDHGSEQDYALVASLMDSLAWGSPEEESKLKFHQDLA